MVEHIGEIGATLTVGQKEVSYLSLFGAGLDGVALDTIEDTRVDVKTIVATCSVKSDDDKIFSLAIVRHNVFFLSLCYTLLYHTFCDLSRGFAKIIEKIFVRTLWLSFSIPHYSPKPLSAP
jgi:hypothetical protein